MSILRPFRIAAEVAALSAGLASPSPAQTQTPAPAAPGSPASSTAEATKRPRVHFFVGEVAEVVSGERKFSVRETLRDGSPKVTFFTTVAETVVSRGKDRAALADLHVNDHVTVKYTESAGEKRALSIRITPSAKPKAAAPNPPA